MNRRELWRRISQHPRTTRFEEIEKLLQLAGWKLNHVRGSHHVYRSVEGRHLSIPRHGADVKVHYVELVLNETKEPGDDSSGT